MKDFFQKYFAVLDPDSKRKLPWMLLLFLGSSSLDMIGISLVGVFVSLVITPDLILNKLPASLLVMVNHFPRNQFIAFVGFTLIGIFSIKGAVAYFVQKWIARFSFRTQAKLQSQLMEMYQMLPYEQRVSKNSSTLVNMLQYTVPFYVNGVLLSSLQIISNIFIFISICSVLFITNPKPMLLVIGFLGSLFLVYDLLIRKKLRINGRVVVETTAGIIKGIHEGMNGFKEIRVLGCEKHFHEVVSSNSRKFADASSMALAMQYLPRYLVEPVMVAFLIGSFMIAMLANKNPVELMPIFGLFMAAGLRLIPSFTQIVSSINQLRFSFAALDTIYDELMNRKKFDAERMHDHKNSLTPILNKSVFEKIQLDQVSYRYMGSSRFSLRNISLTISAGQSVAFVGPSGAGKTTLIDILLGLLSPTSGVVRVNGSPILQDLHSWLGKVAYIPQNIFIIDDTLRRNIALGKSDDEIDEKVLNRAIHMSQLDSVVSQLDKGVDTLLGEAGVRLSGGQRQRVALARAFYHEREVIVMDEATSALDNETEQEIVKAIKLLKGKKTVIVIAHRLSTVEHCDKIFKLEDGEIVKEGIFQEVCGV